MKTNKNVDIKFSAQLSSGMLKAKIFESQIIVKSFGARKPKGLNRKLIIGQCHPCLKGEYLSFNNYHII